MPNATYMLEMELSYNTWADVTADWHTATPLVIERGIEPGERVAGVGWMRLALYNPDGRYTPEHANVTSGFGLGIGVRLRASDGMNSYPLFYGRLAEIHPQHAVGVKDSLPPGVEIVCLDDMAATHRVHLDAFPLLLDVAPREIVNRLVDRSFTPPGLFGYWRLGHPQASQLGLSTKLSDEDVGKDFDTGQSIFPWVGDTWPSAKTWPGPTTAFAALRDLCTSEGGIFYLRADGTPVFEDRHARPKHTSPDASLSGSLAGLCAGQSIEQTLSRVEVTVHPREAAETVEVLWTAGHSIRLAPGTPRELVCHYNDPGQEAMWVGAHEILMPVQGVDYNATTKASGAGQDATEHVIVGIEPGATSARLMLVSTWPQGVPIYVHNLQLRGKALRAYRPVTVAVEEVDSFLAYGFRPLYLDMPLQDDANVAADMARALLANRKDPHPWLRVGVEARANAALLTQALARDVGDRLSITDASLALEGVGCFIEQVRHEIQRGGARHRVDWRTSPADLQAYWVLGRSGYGELGQATRLGY